MYVGAVSTLIFAILYVGVSQRLKEVENEAYELSVALEESNKDVATLNEQLEQLHQEYNKRIDTYMRSHGILVYPNRPTPTQSL